MDELFRKKPSSLATIPILDQIEMELRSLVISGMPALLIVAGEHTGCQLQLCLHKKQIASVGIHTYTWTHLQGESNNKKKSK